MWTSLEIAQLVVQLLVPVSVGLVGFLINQRLKQIDEVQWKGRKAIEKRIETYERVAPDLNRLYCYMMWIGDWQEVTPPDAIQMKRRLDNAFYVSRYLIGEPVFEAYQAFVALLFRTYHAPGRDALIRSTLESRDGDRRKSAHFVWKPEWDAAFDPTGVADAEAVRRAYDALMQSFKTSIGL